MILRLTGRATITEIASRVVVARRACSNGSTNACGGPRRFRDERRTEFARICAGCVVEPHPGCGMDAHGGDCNCLEYTVRLSGVEHEFAGPSGRAGCRISCLFSYCGY